MTTERLNILAGAAALGEFTAPELAAYTGANANTVRQVLQREQRRHAFFEREDPKLLPHKGRAVTWRLSEKHRAQILDEITREEASLAGLKGAVGEVAAIPRVADPLEKAAMFIASAEEALAHSYSAADNDERGVFAKISLNLLKAANPNVPQHDDISEEPGSKWWDCQHDELSEEFVAPLDTISGVSIESHLRTVQRSHQVLVQEEMLRHRAHRVAAFAALSRRLAQGKPIGAGDLTDAAESISAGSAILPVPQTLSWIKVFVDTSIASGNPAPVAILAKSEQSPEKLFPVAHSAWRRVRLPTEFAAMGYWLWVESWAETLLKRSLIPGVVVAHDDSPESNAALTRVMREPQGGRPVVVASTTTDFEVAAQVAVGGGIFYPIRERLEGLLPTVNRAVVQAVSSSPGLAVSYWMASGVYSYESELLHANISTLDIVRASTNAVVRPADLEIAQKTLAVFDDAVKELDRSHGQLDRTPSDYDQAIQYFEMVRRVADQLSQLGGSSHALAVAEEALGNYQRMIEFKWYRTVGGWTHGLTGRHVAAIEQHREVARDMAWAYEQIAAADEAATSVSGAAPGSLEDDSKPERKAETAEWQDAQMVEDMTRRERRVLRMMAAGKGLKEICTELGVSRETANRLRQSVRRKLSSNLARAGEQTSAHL